MVFFTPRVSSSSQTSSSAALTAAQKTVPKGIATTPSTISSKKDEQVGFFSRIKESIENVFLAIINVFKKIFYRIFPCRSPSYALDAKYRDFKARLNRVDSIGKELALKEADENPYVYTLLGRHVYRTSWNVVWKLSVWIPKIGQKTYKEIGQIQAQNNFKKLVEQLRIYYKSEMESIKKKIDNNNF